MFARRLLRDNSQPIFIPENKFLWSQDFTNAAWLKGSGLTITNTASSDPLGGSNGQRLNTNSPTLNYIYQTITTAGAKTISIYAKQGTNRYLWMYGGATNQNYGALFDLQNGLVATTNLQGSTTNASANITALSDGWYRCSISFTPTANAYQAFASTNNASLTFSANNDITNGSIGNIFIFGAQLQNSLVLVPYTLTTSSPV